MEKTLPDILGDGLREVKAHIPALSREDGPLLIIGEEGAGKSLFARHIHAAAERAGSPPPTVNLATASPRSGFLSLLGADFEHVTTTRRSALEHRGIVLIKHVSSAPRSVQDQLADALTRGRFLRPGAVKEARVRCRPIFTLRVPGEGRNHPADLSDKLSAVLAPLRKIAIPPLRKRPADIRAIARHSLGRELSPELEQMLLAYHWPGNVTELKGTLLLLRPLAGGGSRPADLCLLEVATLLLGIEEGRESSFPAAMARLQRHLATHALRRTDGSISHASALLGLTPSGLRRQLTKGLPPA